jgi:hypothetical protein
LPRLALPEDERGNDRRLLCMSFTPEGSGDLQPPLDEFIERLLKEQ